MAFNFGISAESAVRASRRQLAPWNIHNVKFMGCELREGVSKNDPSKGWKCLDVKFENEDGYYNVSLWAPKDGDDERREYDSKNGGKVIFPSNFEVLMAMIKQTAQVLNPEGFEKMQKASSKFRGFDDIANALIQITDKVKGTETMLKLTGTTRDGKVVATVPRIVGINKQGDAFISDNYIGNKLFFSDYEETQRSKYLNAKPTEMPNDPLEDTASVDKAEETFDLESLL
jgi:hypothetical protein